MPKTRRLEVRIDPDADETITQAAALAGRSRSAFVVEAALEAADRQLARADTTLMPAAQFEAMMASLDDATPIPQLTELLASPRPSRRT